MSRTMTQTLADIDTAVESWETAGDAYRWTPDMPQENDVPPPLPAGTVRRFDAVLHAVRINGVDITPFLAAQAAVEQTAQTMRDGLTVVFRQLADALRPVVAAAEYQRTFKRMRMRHLHTTYSARKRGRR